MHTELHAIIRGRVQGVGFRWTVVEYAQRHHLAGTTRNLPDGTVEVCAQGSQEDLESLLEDIRRDPGLARIESIKTAYHPPSGSYSGFKIVY